MEIEPPEYVGDTMLLQGAVAGTTFRTCEIVGTFRGGKLCFGAALSW